MMPTGVSLKELFLPSLVIFIYLLYLTLLNQSKHNPRLYVCSENGALESFIIYENYEYLLYPKEYKTLEECLGKGMVFYDRSIEYIVGPVTTNLQKKIEERYKVRHNIPYLLVQTDFGKIMLNSYSITINQEKVITIVRNKSGRMNIKRGIHIMPSSIAVSDKSNTDVYQLKDGQFMQVDL